MFERVLKVKRKAAAWLSGSGRVVVQSAVNLAFVLLLAAVILLNLFTHVLQVVHYNGEGMEPTLHSGQTLVLHRTQDVKQGDIIAFYYNNQVLVRRVIAVSNNRVTIGKDGTVLINEQPLEEPYLTEASLGQCSISFPFHVPNGHVFVMGDNRSVAMDSRLKELGSIHAGRIIGRLLMAI